MIKVRAGFYRWGAYCIHKGNGRWGIYKGPIYLKSFATLNAAAHWCDRNP